MNNISDTSSEGFLNKEELRKLIINHTSFTVPIDNFLCFHGIFFKHDFTQGSSHGNYGNEEKFLMVLGNFFHPITSVVCAHQPELQEDFEVYFKRCYTQQYFLSDFYEKFTGKIKLSSTGDLFFKYDANKPSQQKLHLSFLKEMLEKTDVFRQMMHHHLQSYPNGADAVLHQAYLTDLSRKKTPLVDPDKHLQIVKGIANTSDAIVKDKVKCYLKLLPHTEASYERIMADISSSLSNFHEARKYWDNNLKHFPEEVQERYLQTKEQIKPLNMRLTVSVSFELEQQLFFDALKQESSNTVGIFITEFSLAMASYACQTLSEKAEFMTGFKDNMQSTTVHFHEPELACGVMQRLEKVHLHLKRCIHACIANDCHKLVAGKMRDSMEGVMACTIMDLELNATTSTRKKMKI